jgi:hypothetical protein
MDIEISPGAPAQLSDTAARDNWSRALGDGGIQEKRCCSNGHFAIWREKRVRRFNKERAGSVLRHHSSVNLVRPRPVQLAAAQFFGGCRRSPERLASRSRRGNRAEQGFFSAGAGVDSALSLKFLLTMTA